MKWLISMLSFFTLRSRLTADQVLERLRPRVSRPLGELPADAPLDLASLDSLDLVELLCAIDDEFGVALGESDLTRVRTVGDIGRLIARRARPRPTRTEAHHAIR